ncbi:hypothetical protein FHR90_001394 [Endobacter medicaginis]|uniref:Uncharacterized protein n=1 Tax=Endobacter medicaginis TaxID=1181271 RepID=A0A839V244_9PROT|nr:hypothetical protein [Endobacter medicaginis]
MSRSEGRQIRIRNEYCYSFDLFVNFSVYPPRSVSSKKAGMVRQVRAAARGS